jgi:hypothetical protein
LKILEYRAFISGVGNEVVLPQFVSHTDVPKPIKNPKKKRNEGYQINPFLNHTTCYTNEKTEKF